MNNKKTYDEVKQIVHEKCKALFAKYTKEQLRQASEDWTYKFNNGYPESNELDGAPEIVKDLASAIGKIQEGYDDYEDDAQDIDVMFYHEFGIA